MKKQSLKAFGLFFILAITGFSAELRIGSLNCFLLFDPAVKHVGNVAAENKLEPSDYVTKVDNLGTLAKGAAFVGLQEVGGAEEVTALAKATGYKWAFAKGRDTYTGQNVGAVYSLPPGWKLSNVGRVGELESLSKHLLVKITAPDAKHVLNVLTVHMIRPIGDSGSRKHEEQIAALREWANSVIAKDERNIVVILGDTNNNSKFIGGGSLIGFGSEAAAEKGFPATHLNGACYDRLIVAGEGARWKDYQIVRPPYGRNPNQTNKTLWTDHFFTQATLIFE